MLARVVRAIEPARRARVQSGSQRTSLGTSEAGARSMRPPSGGLTVPELTRSASIQLNERVSLRHQLSSLSLFYRILSPSGPSMAKPPGVILRLAAFVFGKLFA
jgi:hypothetical protein